MKGLSVLVLLAVLAPGRAPVLAQGPEATKPAVGEGLRREREQLAGYQWRLRTEMKVDDVPRLQKVEDVHLAPDGGLVKKLVKYEKAAQPTPVAYNDPRAHLGPPASEDEDARFAEQAQDLMQLYARLSPERLDAWAKQAELMPAEREAQVRLHGRGLGRPQDDAVLYLDGKTRAPLTIEIKTTVDPKIVDLAFIRVTFEPLPPAHAGMATLIIPKRIFMNMNRGKRRVMLEMETSEYRTWP